ncbi:MAG: mycofactocin biosynthesis peptidyl-dipeptidase MftE [Actinomycetota bacterium]|nr:mycofactocin biosynthesis peptidyl-dipeptidase MftE [Actinomycetota bacterium]
MLRHLTSMTYPEVEEVEKSSVLIIPIGSTEQHGPHLPVLTDSIITNALAEVLAQRRPDKSILAPPITIGASHEHIHFPGTLSIGNEVLTSMVVELGRSASRFAGTLFITAHGGNVIAMARGIEILKGEKRRVTAWWPTQEVLRQAALRWSGPDEARGLEHPDLHAGRTETSAMMALAPDMVHLDRAESGGSSNFEQILPHMINYGVKAVSTNGVIGDPTGSNQEEGAAILGAFSNSLVEHFDGFYATVIHAPVAWPTL